MYLRYDGFDNQVLDCLPYMSMVDINALHITPKSFQTPIGQKIQDEYNNKKHIKININYYIMCKCWKDCAKGCTNHCLV